MALSGFPTYRAVFTIYTHPCWRRNRGKKGQTCAGCGRAHEDLSLVGLGFVDGGTGLGQGHVGGVGWEREVGRVERGFGLGDGPVTALEDLVDVVG